MWETSICIAKFDIGSGLFFVFTAAAAASAPSFLPHYFYLFFLLWTPTPSIAARVIGMATERCRELVPGHVRHLHFLAHVERPVPFVCLVEVAPLLGNFRMSVLALVDFAVGALVFLPGLVLAPAPVP